MLTRCQKGVNIAYRHGHNSDRYWLHKQECGQCIAWHDWLNNQDNFSPIGTNEEKALDEELKAWADQQLGPLT